MAHASIQFSGANPDPQGDLETTLNFQACFQGRKSQKTSAKDLWQTLRKDPRTTKLRFL